MKRTLTNNIYCVTLKRCACIYVEAESPKEAMKIAENWKDDIDDGEFEDSDVEVDSCESHPDKADSDYMDTIYTKNEAFDADDYIEQYEEQKDLEAWQRVGWDMTNQLELSLEDEK